jgi:hypothetical protein
MLKVDKLMFMSFERNTQSNCFIIPKLLLEVYNLGAFIRSYFKCSLFSSTFMYVWVVHRDISLVSKFLYSIQIVLLLLYCKQLCKAYQCYLQIHILTHLPLYTICKTQTI